MRRAPTRVAARLGRDCRPGCALVSIGGGIQLDVGGPGPFDLALPVLHTIGGDVATSFSATLASISLPQLTHLGGALDLDLVDRLATISLSRVEAIAGDVASSDAKASPRSTSASPAWPGFRT